MRLKKWLIGLAIVIGVLYLLFQFVAWPMLKEETKKISPQETATYNQNGLDLAISYSSPMKKGRVIFGELVPFDKVWRTGANEPTTLTTASAIKIIDKELPAGTYSVWTIPSKESWKVILNKEVPEWGVSLISGGKETTRDPDEDVIQVTVPVRSLPSVKENLDISFKDNNQLYLSLAWDEIEIQVPINK